MGRFRLFLGQCTLLTIRLPPPPFSSPLAMCLLCYPDFLLIKNALVSTILPYPTSFLCSKLPVFLIVFSILSLPSPSLFLLFILRPFIKSTVSRDFRHLKRNSTWAHLNRLKRFREIFYFREDIREKLVRVVVDYTLTGWLVHAKQQYF